MKLIDLGLLSPTLAHFHLLLLLIDKGFPEDVRLPPDITLGPLKEILFRDGQTIRLDCVSKGHPNPWFEWKKDGKTVDPNDPSIQWLQPHVTGSIEIKQAGKARTGYYQCLAKNGHGTAMSNVSFVQMALLDRFPATGIQSHHRTEGENLVLPCHNLNSVPSPTFSWALATSTDDKHPSLFVESDRVRIDEFGSLHFAYVKKEDEYNHRLYKCQVFNQILDITQGGSFANLSITAMFPIPTSAPRPAFKTGSPLIGLVGGGVAMMCLFYGNPVSRVTWQKSSGSLPPPPRWKLDPSSYGTEVRIDKLEKGDAGDYICTGTSTQGVSRSIIILRVEAKPSFVVGTNHLSSKTATEGESLTFTCLAEAIPTPAITWFRNGVVLETLSLPSKYRLSGDGFTLTLSDLCKTCPDGSSDLAVIQCNASNVHGYVFAQGSVNNVLKKTTVVNNSVTVYWESEKEFLFPCFASFDDAVSATHTWFLNNEKLIFNSSVWFDRNNSSLHVKTGSGLEEDRKLLGEYRCEVTNGYSRDFVQHQLLSPEDENEDGGSILAIIIPIITGFTVLLITLAIGATIYGCRKAKKKRDKRSRDKTNAGDGARRRPSSNEADDQYERIYADVVDHEEYVALSTLNDQDDGYEIPPN